MFAIEFVSDGRHTVGLGLLLVVLVTAPGCGADPNTSDPPAEVVRAFLQSLDQHDVEGALARLDDTFVFRSGDGGFEAGKEAMPSMLAWDAAAGSEVEIRKLTSSGDTVRVRLVERNRFTELLELEPVRRWAVEARPAEAAAVFADGSVARYDGPTARRLLALIEAHHRETGEGG